MNRHVSFPTKITLVELGSGVTALFICPGNTGNVTILVETFPCAVIRNFTMEDPFKVVRSGRNASLHETISHVSFYIYRNASGKNLLVASDLLGRNAVIKPAIRATFLPKLAFLLLLISVSRNRTRVFLITFILGLRILSYRFLFFFFRAQNCLSKNVYISQDRLALPPFSSPISIIVQTWT